MAAESTTVAATSVRTSQPQQFQGVFSAVIPFTFTADEDSIADQAASQGAVTVPGAALGDFVLVAPEVDVADLLVSATVTATDTVSIVFGNLTAAAVTALSAAPKINGVVLKAGPLFD